MKENKNGVKLLVAVFAIAMMFAGIVIMIDDSSDINAEKTAPTLKGSSSGFVSLVGMTVETDDSIVYSIFGTSSATNTQTEFEIGNAFETADKSFRYMTLEGIVSDGVTIKQTNSALNEAYPGMFPGNVKEKTYTGIEGTDDYVFLIPKDHSDITIEVTSGNNTDRYVIQCAGAIYANADGKYVWKLSDDVEVNYFGTFGNETTIDLNGKTLTTLGTYLFADSTISNGKMTGELIQVSGCSLNMNGVTFDSTSFEGGCGILAFNSNDNVKGDTVSCNININESTIKADYYAISGNNLESAGSIIKITNSTLTTTEETCVYIPMESNISIESSTITGPTGIEIKMGTLELKDTDVIATGEYSPASPSGDGTISNGAGLLVSAQKYGDAETQYIESAALTVSVDSNCTLQSVNGVGLEVINAKSNKTENQTATVSIGCDVEKIRIADDIGNENRKVSVTLAGTFGVDISGTTDVTIEKDSTISGIIDGIVSIKGKTVVSVPSGKNLEIGENATFTMEEDSVLLIENGASLSSTDISGYGGKIQYGNEDITSVDTQEDANTALSAGESVAITTYDGNSDPISVPKNTTLIVTGTATGEITVEGTLVVSTASELVVSNGTGTTTNSATITSTTPITITLGSIKIDGEDYAEVTINDAEGDVRVGGSMAANGTFTINVKTGATANIYFENGFKLAAGATFTINGTGATANVLIADDVVIDTLGGTIELKNATMNIMGQVIGSTGKIDADSTSKVYVDSGAIVAPELTGEGEFYTEDAMREFHISQDIVSPVNTTEQQRVIIDKSITIYAGASLNIRGELVVAEGMKITVKENGLLSINGVNSIANIAGTIVIEGTDGFYFNGKDLNVTGTLDVKSGSATIYNGQTAIDGTVRIQKNASAAFGSGIVVNETGTLEIQGTITGDVAKNYGKVLVNGTASSFTVANQVGGTVDIQSVKGTVTVTDDGMFIRTGVVISDANDNTVTVKDLKGVIITSDYTTKVNNSGEKEYINQMFVSGAASAFKQDGYGSAPLITINEGKVTVADSLDLGTIKMNVIGKLDVIGTITVAESNDASGDIYGAGEIKVSGLIQSAVEIDGSGATDASNISAVKYSVRVDTITTYYYTNLKAAIESGEKELTVLGTLYVEEDVTIPAQIEIEATDVNIDEDVTLVIAEGSSFNATRITVDGTLDVQNNDDLNCSTIISDTSAINEKSSIYTNVYNALLKAENGDVVKITKKDGAAILKKDAEVKEGVTLEVPTGRSLGITEGYALTVNGKLYVNNGAIVAVDSTADDDALADFSTSVKDTAGKLHAVIKVTGTIESNAEFEYNNYKVAGAYYSVKAKHYITTIEKAAPGILGFNDYEIVINGTNTVGDVSFVGTADKAISVEVKTGGITADTMTVAYGTMTFDAGVKVTGQFGTSAGNIDLVNMKVSSSFIVSDATDSVNEVQVFTVSGTVVTNDDKKLASVEFNGAVFINGALSINTDYRYPSTGPVNTIGSVTITEDAVVTVGKLGTTGSFTLNTALAANVSLNVYGTLQALNGGSIAAAPGDVLDITVYGKLVEGVKDNDAGTVNGIITARNIFVGIAVDDVLTIGSNATIEGSPAITNILYVADGCTVPSKLIKDKPLITFTVEEKKWFTAYSFGATEVTVNTIPVENVDLITWKDADGKRITSSGPNADENYTITFDGEINAIASIKYDVYNVLVYVCEGIDDVYIDGNLMLYVTIDNSGFAAFGYNVKAGEHTITYTLSNGYSGTATMYLDGEKVSGYKVTTTGDDRDYFITLQGIEKSGYVPESPDTPAPVEPTKDEGLGITEYLLIVLVILAAILVVVVAIRMMRS